MKASFTILASDEAPEVRAGLAANPKIPRAVAERLAADPCEHVRTTLAICTEDTWISTCLSTDLSDYVRWHVVGNPATAGATVRRLTDDTNEIVREAAYARLAGEKPPRCSLRIKPLRRLAQLLLSVFQPAEIRRARCENSSTYRLAELAGSDTEDVREAVAANPGCPHEARERLTRDLSPRVRATAAEFLAN